MRNLGVFAVPPQEEVSRFRGHLATFGINFVYTHNYLVRYDYCTVLHVVVIRSGNHYILR